MAEIAQVDLRVNPVLDVQTFNALLKLVKESLGELGGGITLIDPEEVQRELRQVENALEQLEKSTDDAFDTKDVKGFRDALNDTKKGLKELIGIGKDSDGVKGLFNLEAAERFQGFLEGAADKTKDASAQMDILEQKTQLEGKELERLKQVAGDVFVRAGGATGFKEFSDAIESTGVARKALGDTLNPEGLTAFVAGMKGVSNILEVEVNEALKKGANFVKAFKLDGQEAYELIALGAQKTNIPAEDYLDILAEYSPHFKEAGFSAQEMIGVLINGGEEAIFNLDQIANAAKETKIRIDDGSIEADLSGLDDKIPTQLKAALLKGVEQATKGEVGISEFLLDSTKRINESDLSDSLKRKLFAAIAGTPAEELGGDLYARIFGSDIDSSAIEAQAAQVGDKLSASIAPKTPIEEFFLFVEAGFGQLAGVFAPALGPSSQLLAITNQLGPAMKTLKIAELAKSMSQFGLSILQKVIPGMVTQVAVTGTQAGANTAATTTQYALNTAMLANPALAVAAGIGVLVGALLLFAGSGESVEEAIEGVNQSMGETKQVLADTAASDKQAQGLRDLADEYDKLQESTAPEDQKRFAQASEELADKVPSARSAMAELNDEAERSEKAFPVNTELVRQHADSMSEMNKVAREGALAKLRKELGDLVESTTDAREEVADLSEEQEEFARLAQNAEERGLTSLARRYNELANEAAIEAGELATEYNKGNSELQKGVKFLVEQGGDVKELADEWDLTVDEVEEMIKQEELAEKAAEKTADATGQIGAAASDATADVAALGSQFDAMLKSAQDGVRAAQSNIAAILQAQRSGFDKNFEGVNRLFGGLTGVRVTTQDILDAEVKRGRELKDQADQGQELLRQSGELLGVESRRSSSSSSRAKSEATAFEKAEKQFKLASDRLSLDERITELGRESLRLSEGREATVLDELESERAKLDFVELQIAALKKALGIAKDADLSFENIGISLKEGEDFEAHKLIDEVLADLQEQANATEAVRLKAKAEIDPDAVRGLQEQQLQLKIGLGLADDASFTSFLVADVERLESELESFTESERERLKGLLDEKVISEKEYADLSEQLDAGRHQRQFELQNAIFERQTTLRDRQYELEIRALDRRQAKETALLQAIADENVRVREGIAQSVQEIEDRRIDRDANQAISRLEFQKEQELLTIEDYEARKQEIEEESARRRGAIQARFLGDQLEQERAAALESLQLQRQQTQERIDALTANNKFEELANSGLLETLDDLDSQIAEKGGFLTNSLSTLQGEFGDAVVTLFDFDSEKAKEPWRNILGIAAGGLERLFKAKATELALRFITPIGGPAGALLSFAAKPIIEGILSRIVSPALDSLLSFASGGLIESPTLFLAGDGSKLGEMNKEWIFTHNQLHDVMELVVIRTIFPLLDEMQGLRQDVRDLQFKLFVSGSDLTTATKRAQAKQRRRVINKAALAA